MDLLSNITHWSTLHSDSEITQSFAEIYFEFQFTEHVENVAAVELVHDLLMQFQFSITYTYMYTSSKLVVELAYRNPYLNFPKDCSLSFFLQC